MGSQSRAGSDERGGAQGGQQGQCRATAQTAERAL